MHDAALVLAPSGRLKAVINISNPVLAQRNDTGGEPGGVSVTLAQGLAEKLGVPVELVVVEGAMKAFNMIAAAEVDVGFVAIEPARAAEVDFSAAYALIEGAFLAPEGRLENVAAANIAGVRIAVVTGSAYDLYLTRTLKKAELIRRPRVADTFAALRNGEADLVGGVRQILVAAVKDEPHWSVSDDSFMVIEQAVAIPKGRDAGLPTLWNYVEDMKSSGTVAQALAYSGQADVAVAPNKELER